MKTFSLFFVGVMLVTTYARAQEKPLTIDATASIQEADDQKTKTAKPLVPAANLLQVDYLFQGNELVPFVLLNYGMHSSIDGEYIAQSKLELQTYKDLGLKFEYIDSDAIRKQLQLNQDEGILIAATQEDGRGHKSGFRSGDLVLKVDDQKVGTQYDFVISVAKKRGQESRAVVRRDGQVQELTFTLDTAVESEKRWVIGVSVEPVSELLQSHLHTKGVVIKSITDDGPAKKMGMKPHDIITNIDASKISNVEDLRKAIATSKGKPVTINVIRAGNRMTVELSPIPQRLNLQIELTRTPALKYLVTPRLVDFSARSQTIDLLIDAKVTSEKNKKDEETVESQLKTISRQIELLNKKLETISESIKK